jgi:hypothetical protein
MVSVELNKNSWYLGGMEVKETLRIENIELSIMKIVH